MNSKEQPSERQSRKGKSASRPDKKVAPNVSEKVEAKPPVPNFDLKPVPRRVARILGVAGLSAFAMIGHSPLLPKVVFILMMALMLGTWRQFRVSEKSLKQRWTVAFVTLPQKSWKLRRYTRLETRYEAATGILELLVFGPFAFIYGWIADTFFPWVGGTYQIWLNNEADDGVLAWQGNSQSTFEENLELLKSVTGLPVTARG